MLQDVFVTKIGMTQAWTKKGKRVAVTKVKADDTFVVNVLPEEKTTRTGEKQTILEVGIGSRRLSTLNKPQRAHLEKNSFKAGVKTIRGARVQPTADVTVKVGDKLNLLEMLQVGDVVNVQGVTKGKGFTGAVKRYGFKGGPRTHGQSDRERAVGSIGAGTTPGRVYKGKRMPGHHGMLTSTVKGLVVLYINQETGEIWLNGPIPGSIQSLIRVTKTGRSKTIELNEDASGIAEKVVSEKADVETNQPEVDGKPASETPAEGEKNSEEK